MSFVAVRENQLTSQVTTLVTIECFRCHILFAMPEDLRLRALANHSIEFYCPQGHGQHYVGKTEADKLRDQLEAANKSTEWYRQRRDEAQAEAAHFRKSRDGVKGALAKVNRRVKHGVCPCCKRTFKQLAEHMEAKHPGFAV